MSERRNRIETAAIEVFSENGYAGASTREIARRARVAEGTIFRHFPTKKSLFIGVIRPFVERFFAPMALRPIEVILDQDFDSLEALVTQIYDDRIGLIGQQPELFRMLAQELFVQDELREMVFAIVQERLAPRFAVVCGKLQARGLLLRLPHGQVARIIVSNVAAYGLARHVLMPDADWDDAAERRTTIALLVRGLSPPAGEGSPR